MLDKAGPKGNCREKENKPITEAPLQGSGTPLFAPSHTLAQQCILEQLRTPDAVLRAQQEQAS